MRRPFDGRSLKVRALVIIGSRSPGCVGHLLAVLRSLTESDLGNSLIVSVAAGSQYFIVAAARCATAHEMSTRFAAMAGPNFPHFYVDFIDIQSPNQQLKPERVAAREAHESIQNLNNS